LRHEWSNKKKSTT